jgi:DNA polymerase II small subunit
MEKTEILKICMERGILLDREAYEALSHLDFGEFNNILTKISNLNQKFVTKAFLNEKIFQEKVEVKIGISLEISKYVDRNIKVIYSLANATKKIEPDDFVKHFRNRYNEIKKILMERKELDNLSSINKISGEKQKLSIIGMVYSKRVTKNKNIFIEIEDSTGRINVVVSKNKAEVYAKAKDVIMDDIIAITGSGSSEIIYANDIIYPDSFLHEKNYLGREENVAFISDIHVGSKMFLRDNFQRFIHWINGEVGDEKQKEEALKVKYLLVTGDTIDGVGVFPNQEELLELKDIKEQYKTLAYYLGQIRKDVKIILCPGQHDSVRIAEPQPAIGRDYAEPLYELENLILVSNPAIIEIINEFGKKGIRFLMYHGASLIHYVNEIESLRMIKAHDTPSKVVREMLKRRHLATIHSSVTYIPTEAEDMLVIKEVPDVIVTADFHRADIDLYNNILIVCNSCWQSTTPFEEKVGNHPDPCKVPLLNLKTREIKILDFTSKENNLECSAK